MNERIKKLARHCGLPTDQDRTLTHEVERFALLIVRECAKVAEKAVHNDNEFRCMYDILTEHFGVEE